MLGICKPYSVAVALAEVTVTVGIASQVLQNSVAALWSDFCVMLETRDEQKPRLPERAMAEEAVAKTVTSVAME